MNHTIAEVKFSRLSSLVDATAYHAIKTIWNPDHPESCVHAQVQDQALRIFATDGVCASWGSVSVEAGDTESVAINAKELLAAMRTIRKTCGRKYDGMVTLSRIDDQLRVEACGESLSMPIRSKWDKYHWIMTPPKGDVFTEVHIDAEAAHSALKGIGHERVKISVSAADETAKQWLDIHVARIDDREEVTYELLHTLGAGAGEHQHESRDVFVFADTFGRVLKHARKGEMAKMQIYKRWLSRNHGCIAIHDGIATHVVMPAEPIK